MNNFNPQNSLDESFNCTYGCENANQCEFNNFIEPNHYQPQPPQQQAYPINNGNIASAVHYDDGVVPSNLYENGSYQQHYMIQNNYGGVNNNFNGANVTQNVSNATPYSGNSENYYYLEQSYTPCRGPRPWNFAECFGFYGDAPCQYANVAVDMEDLM